MRRLLPANPYVLLLGVFCLAVAPGFPRALFWLPELAGVVLVAASWVT